MDRNLSNEEIIKSLYKSRKSVFQWIKKNNGCQQDAEDVFQESLIIYLKYVDLKKFENTSLPLFMTICKRYWLGLLRKRKIQFVPFEEINSTNEIDKEIDSSILNECQLKAYAMALENLGEKCRELLNLFYFQKFDMATIANKLGFRNEHVARSMKYKCIDKARSLIIKNDE